MNPAKHKSFADFLILSLFSAALFGFKLGERALWSPVEGHYSENREGNGSRGRLSYSLARRDEIPRKAAAFLLAGKLKYSNVWPQ